MSLSYNFCLASFSIVIRLLHWLIAITATKSLTWTMSINRSITKQKKWQYLFYPCCSCSPLPPGLLVVLVFPFCILLLVIIFICSCHLCPCILLNSANFQLFFCIIIVFVLLLLLRLSVSMVVCGREFMVSWSYTFNLVQGHTFSCLSSLGEIIVRVQPYLET